MLDGPTLPIVAEGDEEPNDTYVEQLIGDPGGNLVSYEIMI